MEVTFRSLDEVRSVETQRIFCQQYQADTTAEIDVDPPAEKVKHNEESLKSVRVSIL